MLENIYAVSKCISSIKKENENKLTSESLSDACVLANFTPVKRQVDKSFYTCSCFGICRNSLKTIMSFTDGHLQPSGCKPSACKFICT